MNTPALPSALAGGGITAHPATLPGTPTRKVRFGLLGTGYWAANTHGPGLAGHPDVDLVGVWGRRPGPTARLAGELDCRAYGNVDDLIDDVEAVAIALPPDVQAPLARRAALAGRHLLLDKPLALTVTDADLLAADADATGVAGVVFFTRRFDPLVAQALADAAQTPGWYGARTTIFAANLAPGSPYADSPWRREHGGLWDIGPHALSRLLPVLGPVAAVTSLTGPYNTAHVLLRHDGGAISDMALSADVPVAAKLFETTLYGSSGALVLPGGSVDYITAYHQAVTELLVQIRTGRRDHPCGVRFARDVVAILDAVETALHQQSVVALT